MEYLAVKYIHLLALVYWLGGDLGTFIASRFLIQENLGAQARLVAARILIICDQGPRFAMPVILPTGLHLAWLSGLLPLSAAAMTVLWIIALVWLATVLALHFLHGRAPAALTGLDWTLRVAICVVALAAGLYSLLAGEPLGANWVACKLMLFGLTVLMGLMIRVQLKPFFKVFGKLAADQVDAHTNTVIRHSLTRTLPFVFSIWILLLLAAAFGIHLLR